ncbi:MAG TPA: glycosyltransferase, partial [Thermoclostridium sp.]|nr:glycosyltransferase [Thermoclostridium sp.]
MLDENIMNNQTRVCHVTSAHPRHDPRIFYKECRSLAEHAFDVVLLVNDNLPDETIDGVKIKSTRFVPRNRYERMIKSKKHIKKLMREIDADIYHFHDPELLPEAAWIKKKSKKVIFDFHEDVPQQILFKNWIPQKSRKIISRLYLKYEKKIVKNLAALVSVTPQIVEKLKCSNPNTVMITNYPILRNKEENTKNRYRGKNICFAGGISPQWNHENIIKAIESIEGVE